MANNLPDQYIRRQFYVIGLGNMLGDEFARELNDSDRDSRAILLEMLPEIFDKRPLSRIRADKLERLADEIAEVRGERMIRYRDEFEKMLGVLVRGEYQKSNETFSKLPIDEEEPEEDPTLIIPLLLANGIYSGGTIDEWFESFRAGDRTRIGRAISQGVANNESAEAIATGLFGTKAQKFRDGALVTSQNSARMLARTVTAGVANRARSAWADAYQKTVGAKKKGQMVSSGKLLEVFSAILDSKTSFLCASLSGNTYAVGTGPYPPLHPNCRSTRYPIPSEMAHPSTLKVNGVDFSKNARRRVGGKAWDSQGVAQHTAEVLTEKKRWLEKNIGTLPESMDFEPWFARQPKSFQRDYLGKNRFARWDSGDLDMGDFVAPSGSRYTIAQLVNKGIL